MNVRVFDDRSCYLGEGPIWHSGLRTLFWFDIINKRLLARGPDGPRDWQFDECHSAAGIIDDKTLLIASETGLWRFDIATGARTPVKTLEADRPDTRSNDGRADPYGGFWIGTMGKRAEPEQGAIYRYFKGELRQLHAGLTIPNAICFSPDGAYAYFACTRSRTIRRQALDAEGWPRAAPEVFADLRDEGLNPDGAVVDAEGCLWNAQWGAGRVARYRPDGTFDRAFEVPGRHCSCPAFGGPGLGTLFATTAQEGMDQPDSAQGLVYAIDVPFRGRDEPRVIVHQA
ncbi:SMP-30/gluconolactonase/LRE family protein [Defluviimonas sp. WL0002]|uniref:SMP-30/gluconolactonase/LRE family protein n=1 Tax=Albidovulum marisflavi TaxID=2984159 RepID=A0ABT2ZCM8_9RHOB|nr:SMP-30/gluconolactonase/LRE family protein [Defluviimonas sp. WL0002]MCV2868895.1 SMP-30/gluconolactonase/LRE family protein [Defluviimonas sp. WL0002]